MKTTPVGAALLLLLAGCGSDFTTVGSLEIQIRPEGILGQRFAKEGEFELISSVSAYGDILSDSKRIPGQTNLFLIHEDVSAGDLRGAHAYTDYLLLYSNRERGLARPHPQVIPIDLALKKPRGVWSDWIAPKHIQNSVDSWDLLHGTKQAGLVPLTEQPLAMIRFRLVASPR